MWIALVLAVVLLTACGGGAQEAAGLQFQAPEGYALERQRAGRADAVVFVGDEAVLVLAWTPVDQVPDAGAVVDAALRARGLAGGGYAVGEVLTLDTRTVAGTAADYLETVWVPRQGQGPRRHVRMVLFSGPQATYVVALVTAERPGPRADAAWERFLASLRWAGR